MTASITSKYQMVLPKEIRERLGVHPGDKVDFVIERDGRVVVRALTTGFGALRGLVKHQRTEPVSLEEMDRAISRNVRGEQ